MKSKDNLSPLGLQAIELDTLFSEMQRLSAQIEKSPIDTESDFQLAIKLLNRFTEKAMAIEGTIGLFAQHLQKAREDSDTAVKIVSEKAQLIQQRKQDTDGLQEKLNELGIRVRDVVAALAKFNKPATEEEKSQIPIELQSVELKLTDFINEADSIKNQAHEMKCKDAFRSAESLHATLQNAKAKLGAVISSVH